MKMTISRPDNMVTINGESYPVDCSSLNEFITVIQWDETEGHIEFDNSNVPLNGFRRNGKIDDFEEYTDLIAGWQAAKTAAQNAQQQQEPAPSQVNMQAAMLVQQSFMASRVRAAQELADSGDTFGAVKMLLNIK